MQGQAQQCSVKVACCFAACCTNLSRRIARIDPLCQDQQCQKHLLHTSTTSDGDLHGKRTAKQGGHCNTQSQYRCLAFHPLSGLQIDAAAAALVGALCTSMHKYTHRMQDCTCMEADAPFAPAAAVQRAVSSARFRITSATPKQRSELKPTMRH